MRREIDQSGTDKDALLMARTAAGDLSAFEEIVIRNQSGAWTIAFHCLYDPAEAEDIVQEAFLKLLKSASRYRPTASFRTYFTRIVVRLCLDFRSKKRPVYRDVLPDNVETGNDPEELLHKKEIASAFRRALADLPPTQRMALLLRHLEGFTYFEIAEAMDISARSVDALLQRGRQALRSRFGFSSK